MSAILCTTLRQRPNCLVGNMFALLRHSVHECQAHLGSALRRLPAIVSSDRSFHAMTSQPSALNNTSQLTTVAAHRLLPVQTGALAQIRGLKHVQAVHRRCKYCTLMMIDGVLHNHCSVHPRHKQKKKTIHPKHTWVITHAMQTKKRPW